MSEARRAVFGRAFARDLWRLVRVYWTSRAARWGALLLAGAVGLELATVFGNSAFAMEPKDRGWYVVMLVGSTVVATALAWIWAKRAGWIPKKMD